MSSYRYQAVYRFTAASIGVILALIIAEAAVRIYTFKKYSTGRLELTQDEDLIYAHKPSIAFTNKHGVEVRYNSLGFIGEEVAPKGGGVFRILGIGDSIAEAEYLPDGDRYIDKLGKLLFGRASRQIETVNAGVGGYNTWQELAMIKKRGLAVEPDLIIVGICQNDFFGRRPNLKGTFLNMVTENSRDGSRARYLDFLYQRSDLYKLLYDGVSRMKKKYRPRGDDGPFSYKPTNMAEWEDAFLDMYNTARGHNIQLLFVIFPMEQQVTAGEKHSCKELTDFFEGRKMDHIDLIDRFKDEAKRNAGKKLFIERDNLHPNDEGHRVSAEAIADYIASHGMLK